SNYSGSEYHEDALPVGTRSRRPIATPQILQNPWPWLHGSLPKPAPIRRIETKHSMLDRFVANRSHKDAPTRHNRRRPSVVAFRKRGAPRDVLAALCVPLQRKVTFVGGTERVDSAKLRPVRSVRPCEGHQKQQRANHRSLVRFDRGFRFRQEEAQNQREHS